MRAIIFYLFYAMGGLAVFAVLSGLLWNMLGKPKRWPLATATGIAISLFKIMVALGFVVIAASIIHESQTRGTDWYKFRMANPGRFMFGCVVFGLSILRIIQKTVREVRRDWSARRQFERQ